MTLAELERNLVATLGLAVIAGREEPDRHAELGGNAVVLLGLLQEAGGLEALVRRCAGRPSGAVGAGGGA